MDTPSRHPEIVVGEELARHCGVVFGDSVHSLSNHLIVEALNYVVDRSVDDSSTWCYVLEELVSTRHLCV